MKPHIDDLKLTHRLEAFPGRKLVGLYTDMTFVNNTTRQLWQTFMPRRKEIMNNLNQDFYSIEIYKPGFFDNFNPVTKFQKWAAIEVLNFEQVPTNMETIVIPAGRYAVFIHQGTASDAPITYRYIFERWMPRSVYEVDDRPHFAIMGEKYKHADPASEEEIWIPVKPK